MEKEILRLFKSYLGKKSKSVNKEALTYGLIIPSTAPDEVVQEAIKQYGKDGKVWNQTFHKSWNKVKDSSVLQLLIEQIVHYITTYGFEALGIYDENNVYIPAEKLEVPDLDTDKIEFIKINPITEKELTEKLMVLVTSGIALSETTVNDIKALSDYIDKERFDEVSNREVRTFLYDKYNIMPKNPEAFLRYLIYKTTGATLKIQNVSTYRSIRRTDKKDVLKMLNAYIEKTPHGYEKLSSIFLRNKNLFLAFKTKESIDTVEGLEMRARSKYELEVNTIINKLRKLAVYNHKPLQPKLLDSLTSVKTFDKKELTEALDKVTEFRKIRLLNALNYRLKGEEDIVYRVRNGKSYVGKIDNYQHRATMEKAFDTIEASVIKSLSKNVKGKTVYIPEGLVYKAPTSEKQFVGNIPEGSYVELDHQHDLVFGVRWNDLKPSKNYHDEDNFWGNSYNGRVDLDLHMVNQMTQFGWNSSYKDEHAHVMFSGDLTSAPKPNGATELFFVSHNYDNCALLLTLNDFNGHDENVPYKFMVAKANKNEFDLLTRNNRSYRRDGSEKHYMVNPSDIVWGYDAEIKPDARQITLGMIKKTKNYTRLYFNNYGLGNSCNWLGTSVTGKDKFTIGALSYMENYNKTQIELADLLKKAGAKLVTKPTITKTVTKKDKKGKEVKEKVEVPVDINLSFETITKETVIKLFSKQK